MKEWLRFSVCWWHTFVGGGGSDPFGAPTYIRDWEEGFEPNTIELSKRRIDVAFEFFTKLGVEYYCFHDFDVAPEGETIEESWKNLDIITDYLKEKQDETGVKLSWATQNLFSNPRYMNGGMTNPDVDVFCYSAAAIQKVCDINHKLGGLNHVFWGGREGYQSLLNTDLKKEYVFKVVIGIACVVMNCTRLCMRSREMTGSHTHTHILSLVHFIHPT